MCIHGLMSVRLVFFSIAIDDGAIASKAFAQTAYFLATNRWVDSHERKHVRPCNDECLSRCPWQNVILFSSRKQCKRDLQKCNKIFLV